MKTKDKITLEIDGYYKKGDDFEFLLREYSPQKALEMWGEGLVEMGKNLQRAAELLKNEKLEAGGGTHVAWLSNIDKKIADELLKMTTFSKEFEFEEDQS